MFEMQNLIQQKSKRSPHSAAADMLAQALTKFTPPATPGAGRCLCEVGAGHY